MAKDETKEEYSMAKEEDTISVSAKEEDTVVSSMTKEEDSMEKDEDTISASSKEEDTMEVVKLHWVATKERIMALVKTVSIPNVQSVADQIMNEDIVLGKGPFCDAVIRSQFESPDLSHVYASLVAIINSTFPEVGYLLVKRVVLQFREAYDDKDTVKLEKTTQFLGHLVNQNVVYELLALDLICMLIDPDSDNINLALSLCMQCGLVLMKNVPGKLNEIFKEFGRIKGEYGLEEQTKVLMVRLFMARRSGFKSHRPKVLDLVEDEDKVTHEVSLLHHLDPETYFDSFEHSIVDFDSLEHSSVDG